MSFLPASLKHQIRSSIHRIGQSLLRWLKPRQLHAYVAYFNQTRPHQGHQQQNPDPPSTLRPRDAKDGPILAVPVLGRLHDDYRRAA